MSRKPKPRVSYKHDAQFLLRLAHAVERDESRPASWRSATVARIQALAYTFLEDTGGQETPKARRQEEAQIVPEERDPGED